VRGVAGVAQIGVGLLQFALRLFDLRRITVGIGARRLQGGGGGLGAVDGLIVLLLRDFLLVDQLLVADQIVLRFVLLASASATCDLAASNCWRALDSGLRAGDTGLRAAHLARSAHVGDRDVDAGGGSLRLRIGIFRARLGHGDFVIGGVDFHQHGSLFHVLVIFAH
jgi:hypothetical protein